ncbi:hypothetical protein AD941_00755 [Gluconobacter albidus]|uniref:Tyr recombinase domain-containing protein n=1 Tax=Gluconobacter albidus TaxID=318683 RepID=A0AAW3R0S1_9PROT|nr:hypothetical protein AD941_00755 [Gluconobacter albidus]
MGVNRSAYCCRHTYITNMLKKGVPAYIIAKNCGTSVKMISDTYDSNTVSAYKNILIQDLYT